jgi:hypothetical protein
MLLMVLGQGVNIGYKFCSLLPSLPSFPGPGDKKRWRKVDMGVKNFCVYLLFCDHII